MGAQPETAVEMPPRGVLGLRPPPPVVIDIFLAFLIIAMTYAPVPGDHYVRPTTLTLVFAGVTIVLLPLRRHFPRTALALAVACFTIVALTGVMSSGLIMAVAIMVFGYVNHSTRRRGILVAVGIVVFVIVLSIPLAIIDGFSPRVVQFALTIAVAVAAGDATRSRRQFIEAITERARRAEETREAEARRRVSEERLRIARDLHDVVAHQIAVISLNAGVATSSVDAAPELAKTSLATIREASRSVLSEIGDLMAMLRSDDDGSATASTAPQHDLGQLDQLITQFTGSGLDITLRCEGDLTRVGSAASTVAYRVIQEALTNAHKHGADHRAHLLVVVEESELRIIVTNPFDAADPDPALPTLPTPNGAGLGLIGVRERVASVRGQVEAGPAPGGWRVAARIPLSKEPLT
ncbi:sensor histidine kinase [Leucobacter viscericola]|uniref:histidine kinase n=1 Tax=Leucobacter viscericola TaxID=2714935 RepID=A0A6G7XFG6_9MICO|nr:histidine kinase [Leucobacter viscericola]QIK63293.1 sensor histidine kinase [Leucobacter viscericola]